MSTVGGSAKGLGSENGPVASVNAVNGIKLAP